MSFEVEQLEQQLEATKSLIERRDMAIKLSSNHEFRKLILEDFMVKEAAAYVATSGDPSIPEAGRVDALNIAQAAGHFKRWLSVVIKMGNMAEDSLADLNDNIEEARAEEASE